jgi:hypothetical protein
MTNKNQNGSSEDRRRRKQWLLETWRADRDVLVLYNFDGSFHDVLSVWKLEPNWWLTIGFIAEVKPACRCYRCGKLLSFETLTVDRRIPGCMGGTYKRDNIRPACLRCNSSTGGKLSGAKRAKVMTC